jgi:hypothetical protein
MFVPSLLRDQRQLKSFGCLLPAGQMVFVEASSDVNEINRDINTTSVVGCSRLMMVAMAKNDS